MTLSGHSIKLVPLTAKIIRKRLKQPEFSIEMIGIDRPVRFGSEWPGDLLGMLPVFASALSGNEAILGQYIVVDIDRSLAVGAVGILGEVTPARSVEIGYGMNRSEYGRGYASAAVALLVRGLLERRVLPTRISEVTAKTAVHNVASARVLEKNGFVRTGGDRNDEDGELVTWALERDGARSSRNTVTTGDFPVIAGAPGHVLTDDMVERLRDHERPRDDERPRDHERPRDDERPRDHE